MFGALADDEDHLRFVIERLGDLRTDDRLAMRNQRRRSAHEDGREFRQIVALRSFLDVFEIIQAEANDLSGPTDRQPIGQARQRFARARRRPLGKLHQRLHVAIILRKPFAKIGRGVGIGRLQIDRLVALHNAKPRPALSLERNDFHALSLP